MRIPVIDPAKIAVSARVIVDESEFSQLASGEQERFEALAVLAENYCAGYTGLQKEREYGSDGESNADIYFAAEIVAIDIFDNRQMTAQYSVQNPTVTTILNMHSRNLLPGVGADA